MGWFCDLHNNDVCVTYIIIILCLSAPMTCVDHAYHWIVTIWSVVVANSVVRANFDSTFDNLQSHFDSAIEHGFEHRH